MLQKIEVKDLKYSYNKYKKYFMFRDFISQLECVDKICKLHEENINFTINFVTKKIVVCLNKVKTIYPNIYAEFLNQTSNESFEYAGHMNETEFKLFCINSINGNLTIKNSRNLINVLYGFIKIVITKIIFIGITSENTINYLKFKLSIEKGVNHLSEFICINKQILLKVMYEGFDSLESLFGIENIKTISISQFYKYIVRLSLLEPRQISDQQKINDGSGFVLKTYYKDLCISNIINKYFLPHELEYINDKHELPFGGSAIGTLNKNTNYYRFCTINNIYHVCGLSGSSFEMGMYLLLLDDEINLKYLIIIFVQFHLMRGTHSDLEVFMAFEKLKKYFSKLNVIFKNDNVIEFTKGHLLDFLFNPHSKFEEKLKYKLS